MEKLLHKKYYAFIVTAILFSVSANAQIVYTDVNPDNQIDSTNIVYHLDLNNDGITDYNIIYTTLTQSITCGGVFIRTSYIIGVEPLDSNEVGRDVISSNGFPAALLLNLPIDDTLFTWLNGGSRGLAVKGWTCGGLTLMQAQTYFSCNFLNANSKYLALRLHVASQVYYGWVRLSVAFGVINATIFDYAYNSSPNQPILAGQTTATGIIENSFASSINLFPNPATNQLTMDNGKLKMENVKIYDLTGREVYSENHQTPNANPEISINVSKFPTGMYVVRWNSGENFKKNTFSVTKFSKQFVTYG